MDGWVQHSLRDNNHENRRTALLQLLLLGTDRNRESRRVMYELLCRCSTMTHAISFLPFHTYQIRGTRQEFEKSMTGWMTGHHPQQRRAAKQTKHANTPHFSDRFVFTRYQVCHYQISSSYYYVSYSSSTCFLYCCCWRSRPYVDLSWFHE